MISVVIPAFNEEKMISDCLISLRNQDFEGNYEIIVVDNASTDKTAAVAREMGARVIFCSEKGVTYARQAGADAAAGEIVIQADADTVYPVWWLSRIQKQFNSHPGSVAIAGTFVYKHPPSWAYVEYFLRVFFNLLAVLIFKRPYIISGANLAFYKKALVQIGGYDPHSYSSDQFNISTRLSKVGKVIYDRKSWGATSARSVTKPLKIIIVDFFRHLKIFGQNLLYTVSPTLKSRAKKASSILPKKYIVVGLPVLLIGILCYGYYVPSSPVFGKVYYKSIKPEKAIALTFDDGPNEPYTTQLLNVLDANNIKATFFLVGANVQLYPDIARRMVFEEHVIGNHTFSHDANHALFLSSGKDISQAQRTIYRITGVEPHLYRPPHGKKSPWELEALKGQNLIEVVWNISTNELSGKSPEFLAEQIVQKAKPGGIILLHDGYGTLHGSDRSNKSLTVEMVPIIIQRLESEGYTFVTIPQLLDAPAYNKVSE